jgi:serine/threonine-protein kinase
MVAPAPLPAQVGDLLAGKYQVERVLGLGGMGMVVAARHVDLGELRAVKLMLPQALADPISIERFLREARAAARLRGEHIAQVHDVGRLESGAPFIVMEHLDGTDLARRVLDGGPMSFREGVTCVLDACEALAEAHAAGIVHRDLKPANLFLTTRRDGSPSVKVLDFGISKLVDLDGGGHELTTTAAVMGSPLYMSPEQVRSSRDVDLRADIWALGVILFWLLTGKLPFHAENRYELCMRIVQDAPLRPSEARADMPRALEAVILRCLQKDPARRYPDVAALAADIAPFAPGKETDLALERLGRLLRRPATSLSSSEGRSQAQVALTPVAAATDSAWNKESPRPAPSRALAIAGAALAMVATGGTALWLMFGRAPLSPSDPAGQEAAPAAEPPIAAPASATGATVTPSGEVAAPEPSASASAASAPSAPGSAPLAPAAGTRPTAGGKPVTAKPAPTTAPTAQAGPKPTSQPGDADPFGKSRK